MPLASRMRASALASLIFTYTGSSPATAGAPVPAARAPFVPSDIFAGGEQGVLAREKRYRDDMFDRLEL